jgi:hypothetical protein
MQHTSDSTASPIPTPDPARSETISAEKGTGLWPLISYFLKLGTVGFGGPVALVGFMHRDLVEQRRVDLRGHLQTILSARADHARTAGCSDGHCHRLF